MESENINQFDPSSILANVLVSNEVTPPTLGGTSKKEYTCAAFSANLEKSSGFTEKEISTPSSSSVSYSANSFSSGIPCSLYPKVYRFILPFRYVLILNESV